jgi:hypothetical protein
MDIKYVINNDRNGVELYFDGKPDRATLEALKANRWRWHRTKKCWYNRNTEKNIDFAQAIAAGETPAAPDTTSDPQAASVAYHKNISDYITRDEYETFLRGYHAPERFRTEEDREDYIQHRLANNYQSDNEYDNLTKYIRQAIIWKSLDMPREEFQANGDRARYLAVWDKLPTIDGLKPGEIYSAMWGYDQTNITTATHYGRAFGLDVLITGAFGGGEVLLKRISKDGTFSHRSMHFYPGAPYDDEIDEINSYAAQYGH